LLLLLNTFVWWTRGPPWTPANIALAQKQVDSAIQAATSKLLKMNKNQSVADDTVMKTMVKAF